MGDLDPAGDKSKSKPKPEPKPKPKPEPKPIEDFFFAIEDWQFQRARSVRLDKRMRERRGPIHEWAEITLRGALRHTTKRKFDRGCLRIWPREDREPPEDVRSVGVVLQVLDGEIEAVHTIDAPAFQRLLTVVVADKLVECCGSGYLIPASSAELIPSQLA